MKTLEDLGYVKTFGEKEFHGFKYQKKVRASTSEIIIDLNFHDVLKCCFDGKPNKYYPASLDIDELKAVLAILEENKCLPQPN